MSTSRREFLKEAALLTGAGLAASALPSCSRAAEPPVKAAPKTPPATPVPQRLLGRIGRKVSMVGLGIAPLGSGNSSAEDVTRVVRRALAEGINYVDVASNYGDAESKLKPVLQSVRDKVFW